jgi:hypothetical protein
MEGIPVPAASAARPRRVIASYEDYAAAERALDYLSEEGFPLERLTIVGSGLRTVERIEDRLTPARGAGPFEGGLIGLIVALLAGLLFTIEEGMFPVLLCGLVGGTVVGTALWALARSANTQRRTAPTVAAVEAEVFEIQVDEGLADEANERLLDLAE